MFKPLRVVSLLCLLAAPGVFAQDPTKCSGSLNSSSQTFEDGGGAGAFSGSVTTACGSLTSATSSVPWISVTSATTLAVQFSVAQNTSASTRSGSVSANFGDAPGGTVSFTFSVTQFAKLMFTNTSLVTGAVGLPYSAELQVSGGSDFSRIVSIISGSLPPGLSLTGQAISGTPTASGTFPFTAQVRDLDPDSGNPFYATQSYGLTINPRFAVSTSSPPPATVGDTYSLTLTASGGLPPYSWTIISGSLPPGLSLNSGTGVISGTPGPNTQGTYMVTVQATDQGHETLNVPLTLNVAPTSLAITTSSLPPASAGTTYNIPLGASGGTTPYTWSATGLPSFLNLSSTGQLSGTPPPGTTGTFGFTVKVQDSGGQSQSINLSLQVESSSTALAIVTGSSLPEGREGSVYGFSFQATGGKSPYNWAATGLPAFLSLAPNGALSGTPPTGAANTYSFTVTVTDSAGNKVNGTFSLKIVPPTAPIPLTILTSALTPAIEGVLYSDFLAATGGTPSYTWSATGLPSWLSVSAAGQLSGTPPVGSAGIYGFTVKVQDSNSQSATLTLSLQVQSNATTLVIITTSLLPQGKEGSVYGITFQAVGGKGPYAWAATGLPAFLNLSASGKLSGTPPAGTAGSYSFTVTVTDSAGNKASGMFTLKVASQSAPATLAILTPLLTPATEGVIYSYTLTASGGTPPYAWTATGLPSWLGLSAAGQLSGTPPAGSAGNYNFTVNVQDAGAQSTALPLSLQVNTAPLAIATASELPDGKEGSAYGFSFEATGGKGPYTWTATGLPAFLSLAPSGALSGTPTAGSAGSYSFQVTVSDSSGDKAGGTFSLKVDPVVSINIASPLPQATEGQPYSVTFSASGGTAPYTWAATGLPSWANLSTSGVFSGTPPAGSAGAFEFLVTAKDALNDTQTKTLVLVVLAINGGPTITTTSPLASATVGASYLVVLSATGGTPPYQWSGSGLPGGLALASTGQLSGIPTSPGTATVTAQVTDANHKVAFAALSLPVAATSPFSISTSTPLPGGEVSVPYSTVFQSNGGTRPQVWSFLSGSLPPGLTLDPSGVLSGTPTELGVFDFTVSVTEVGTAAADRVKPLAFASATGRFEVPITQFVTPDLILSCGSLSFGQGSAPLQTCSVISTVFNSIPFSASSNVPWLSVFSTGTTPGRIDVSANPAGLSPGNYTGTITVSSPGVASKTIQVSFNTLSYPSGPSGPSGQSGILQVSPLALTLTSPGTPQFSQSIFVQNVGQGDLQFTASSDVPWLTLSPASGTLSGNESLPLQVNVLAPILDSGGYLGTIEIDSPSGSTLIPVSLLISGQLSQSGPRPKMILSRQGILLQARQGNGVSGPAPTTFMVWSSSSTEIHYTVTPVGGASWLTLVSDPHGTATNSAPGEIAFQAKSEGLPKGAYYALLSISAPEPFDSPLDFLVVLDVEDASAPPVPDTYPSGLVYAATGSANPPSQPVLVYTSSDKPVAYQLAVDTESGGNWLSVTPMSGMLATLSPAQLSVSVNPGDLPPGIYRGGVNISISNLEVRTVNVTLIVPASGAASAAATSSAHPASRATATPAQSGSCTPANLVLTETGLPGNFSTPAAWPSFLAVQLADDCGNPVKDGYVIADFSNGDPPLSLSLSDISMPVYSATWTPVNPVTELTITMQATAPGLNPASTQLVGGVSATPYPILSQNSTVNNLNQQPGAPLAPGTIVAIYGSALAPGNTTASGAPPTVLGGSSVVIGGELAPIFFVSANQINAQLPTDLLPGQQYQVLVLANGGYSSPDTINIDPATPGVERQTNGQVIAQHQNASLVTPDSPAKPGEYLVVYLAGMGLTNPLVAAGVLSPASPLASVDIAPTVTLDGQPVSVQFAGLTPGLVGFYQINFQVPKNAKTGSLELQIVQMGAASNTSVLIVGN